MLAASLVVAFLAQSCLGLGQGGGTIDPATYDIYTDPIHEEWFAASEQQAQKETSSTDVQIDVLNFGYTTAALAVIGYTYTYGRAQLKDTYRACTEYQGGDTSKGEACFDNVVNTASAYAVIGVCGYTDPTACVALFQATNALANTINGNQGQGPSTRSLGAGAPPVPYFPYGADNVTDAEIDWMNHIVDVVNAERAGEATYSSLTTRAADSQPCTNRNSNLATSGHHWKFSDEYGFKLQCKNGCGDTDYPASQMASLLHSLPAHLFVNGDLNAQFTVYDRSSGRVFARCKSVVEDVVSNTCPENITGEGCDK